MFNEVSAKYDPDGNYRSKYRVEFAKEGITIWILNTNNTIKDSQKTELTLHNILLLLITN